MNLTTRDLTNLRKAIAGSLSTLFCALLLVGCYGSNGDGANPFDGLSDPVDDGNTDSPPVITVIPQLVGLSLSDATLDQVFQQELTSYTATVPFLTNTTQITAVASEPGGTLILINGQQVESGVASQRIDLTAGETMLLEIELIDLEAATSNRYQVAVTRQSADSFASQVVANETQRDEDDLFGSRVVIDGDTLAVSAYQEDSNAVGINGDSLNNDSTDAGAVYVFTRDNGVWTEQAYIKASNTNPDDLMFTHKDAFFGFSLALDDNTLAVGARFENGCAAGINGVEDNKGFLYSGAVYVFVREGTTWQQQAYIKPSNLDVEKCETLLEDGDANAEFGFSLALDGDTLAVGSHTEDGVSSGVNGDQTLDPDTSKSTGAVYVFVRDGEQWRQDAYLKASNPDAFDIFGFRVALDNNTLVVGAAGEDSGSAGVNADQSDNSASLTGAAYVFVKDNGQWRQQAYLKTSNATEGDWFGRRIALDGNTIAVSALRQGDKTLTEGDPQIGAVYVFARNGETWQQQAFLRARIDALPTDGMFGERVDVLGDILAVGTGGSEDDIGIGTGHDDPINSSTGSVYLFMRDANGVWQPQQYMQSPDPDTHRFATVSLSEDGSLAVGAAGNTSAGVGGNVYVFK